MGDVQIDSANFCSRLKKLIGHWQANRSTHWANTNALAISVGSASDDLRYLKSISLHYWLFRYELPDTIVVLTKDALHVLTSQKKVSLLEKLSADCEKETGLKLVLLTKPKAEDGGAQMKELLESIRTVEGEPVVGSLPRDKHEGKLFELWASNCSESGLAFVDAAPGLADLLSCKDASETLNIKKAAMLGSKVMKEFVVGKVEQIVDDGKSVKHSKLAELTEEVITDPSKLGVKLKAENVDIAYPPIFQSGGKYDLRVSVPSDDSVLHDGVIVVSIGTRYSSYCANVGRTYLINPTKKQEDEYLALLAAQEAIIASLVEGASISSIVEVGCKILRDKGQAHLVDKLTKSFGHGTGLEFSSTVLASKNTGTVRAGMVFNVVVGAQGLEDSSAKDAKSRTYAIQIADTVVVMAGGKPPEVATSSCPRNWDKISYTLKMDLAFEDMTNGGPSRKTLRSDDPNHKSAEQIRKEKQDALLTQKNEETLRNGTAAEVSTSGRKISEVVAYRSLADIPPSKDLNIQVDSRSEAVLVPIFGVMVPFHITTVKNATSNSDHDGAMVRITFNFGSSYEPCTKYPTAVLVKDLSFKHEASEASPPVACRHEASLAPCLEATGIDALLASCLEVNPYVGHHI
eukprot:gene25578-11229_t